MDYRIKMIEFPHNGRLYFVQRNKFWRWRNLDAYGHPAKYPKYYKSFDDAVDSLNYFKAPKFEMVIYEDIQKP